VRRSTERILTTHVGSLPRPKELLDLMRAMLNGQGDDFEYEQQVRGAVADSVRQQVAHGLDVVSDGEQGKVGFFRYVAERLDGFEARPRLGTASFGPEVEDFPE
jgi:5-methyltetrahydropteroyltriglutamate--homocysteine methyltransferase